MLSPQPLSTLPSVPLPRVLQNNRQWLNPKLCDENNFASIVQGWPSLWFNSSRPLSGKSQKKDGEKQTLSSRRIKITGLKLKSIDGPTLSLVSWKFHLGREGEHRHCWESVICGRFERILAHWWTTQNNTQISLVLVITLFHFFQTVPRACKFIYLALNR